MRILISPHAPNPYDQRMVSGLAAGFRALGHTAIAASSPIREEDAPTECKEKSIDVFFEVNNCRSTRYPLPKGVRHIGWFQDPLMPDDAKDRIRSDDLIYFIIDADDIISTLATVCKYGFLSPGVDETTLPRLWKSLLKTVDFSFCGFLPPPINADKPDPLYAIVKANYRPLRGDLNVIALSKLANTSSVEEFHKILSHARLLDRVTLIRLALNVSPSVKLFGHFWDEHDEFKHLFQGMVVKQSKLYRAFSESRIVLSNNTHGLGINSRNLECMAAGGLLFTHPSPNDGRPGGIKTCFEPGKHYVEYTLENFEETARWWLRHPIDRLRVSWRAAQLVREKHLWRHRAAEISADLSK
jgi:hypothetical protein